MIDIDCNNLSDEQLSALAQGGNELAAETLLRRYKSLAMKSARAYYIVGMDQDDLVQEGMIGLYKSIMSYRRQEQSKFTTFAHSCVRNSIIDAVKHAGRNKHKPLSNYSSLLSPDGNDDDRILYYEDSPETAAQELESSSAMLKTIQQLLSTQEMKVYNAYLSGLTMPQIVMQLGMNYKSVDNALQRIRNKLKTLLQ